MTTMVSGKVTVNVDARRHELRLALFEQAFDEAYAAEGAAFETSMRSFRTIYPSPDALDRLLEANPNALRQATHDVAYACALKTMTDIGRYYEVKRKLYAKAEEARVACSTQMMNEAKDDIRLNAYGMLYQALFGISMEDAIADRIWRLYMSSDFSHYEEISSFDQSLMTLLTSSQVIYADKIDVARIELPRVTFRQPFARKPQIVLGISGMSTASGALSFELEAIQVTNDGFSFASLPFGINLGAMTMSWFAFEGAAARPEKILPSASAFQPGDDPAHVVDGNNGSLWHTPWDRSAALPQWIMLDFGGDYPLTGLLYTPRQDGQNAGNILAWSILVSNDGSSFREVASGYWANDSSPKTITFTETSARYVRLVARDGTEGFASASEVSPIFSGEG